MITLLAVHGTLVRATFNGRRFRLVRHDAWTHRELRIDAVAPADSEVRAVAEQCARQAWPELWGSDEAHSV